MHGNVFTHMFCLMLLTLATTELSLLWDAWRCVYTHALSYAVNTGDHRIIIVMECMEMSLHMFCLMLLTLATTELSLLWDTWRCVYTPVLSYAVNTSNHRIITAVGCMEMSLHTCFVLHFTLATSELSLLWYAWRCI